MVLWFTPVYTAVSDYFLSIDLRSLRAFKLTVHENIKIAQKKHKTTEKV